MMDRLAVVLALASAALLGATVYLYGESRRLDAEVARLDEAADEMLAANARLRERMETVESQLADARAVTGEVCDRVFPAGLYRLRTNTSYGVDAAGDYEIYHVSLLLSQWSVNIGTRLNAWGIPTDFYFDYDGDGRIDTPLAARFAREIPVAGNALADRLLADSRVNQSLYAVFSCEWRNAEFTSSEDMNAKVSGTSNMLWDLVQQHSEDIVDWIGAQ